ncbi:inverse autotransporter beta domain-containing protein [Enterobacter asburiae]|uniref:inverse autotransporter beta domain-containing protein n=1 Tax=Enterobacter asburiae TaxID=61645 RepID=UPI00192BBB0C|nr:inverse autotransporter beta domain-containing protein [Enterobacter asburiae]MBL5950324.1 inverse autotransporter beta domain-containing protein [Enterobacter asburiae]
MKQHYSATDARFDLPALRRVAYLNIAVQTFFPLAVVFTPLMAGAGEKHFLPQPAPLSVQHTKVYILGNGENVDSVAKKYNMSLDALRRLNQFRTFANGFDHLKGGDELDVPLTPLPEVRWNDARQISSPDEQNEDRQTQKIARYASQAGGFLANNPNDDAAVSMARGMVSDEAGSEIQQWLSRFGTARVQLGVNKNFSLKNSQLDLLMPLYDLDDKLVFTQGSLHRTDDRAQTNLGAGLRYFTPSYMLGGNLFWDYDLSRDHARMGGGVEYWRDFLKLGVNGYWRLTGWKDSPQLADYQERPANGWDLRAQAWVPSLPQLGGKLTYEQYYGKEVALFGVDNRQKNPHAITAGVNYTPVPLITLGMEQRQGQSGKNDSRFTVDMNYQLGVPWRAQVDPTAVTAMRSLAGSRYNLVERNNNIVLEYRKKDIIRLSVASDIIGSAGELKDLQVSVESTYGLKEIVWSASSLLANGGKIIHNGGSDYSVVLPEFQYDNPSANDYILQGVAIDNRGNHSQSVETRIKVNSPEISTEYSSYTPSKSTILADGKAQQVLTLTIRDGLQQLIDVPVSAINIAASSNITPTNAQISSVSRLSSGVYLVTVTAGTIDEILTLTPKVGSFSFQSATIQITKSEIDLSMSEFSVSPNAITANNTDIAVLKFTSRNKDNVPVQLDNGALSFLVTDSSGATPAAGTITVSSVIDSGNGVYTATLKGSLVDTVTLVPLVNGVQVNTLKDIVKLNATQLLLTMTAESDGYSYSALSGYPRSGFGGASFTVKLPSGNASDYNWSVQTSSGNNVTWLNIDNNGQVTFVSQPSSVEKDVMIIATPKAGGQRFGYKFTLDNWYYDTPSLLYADAASSCGNIGGVVASLLDIRGTSDPSGQIAYGQVGYLLTEWNLTLHSRFLNVADEHWTSDDASFSGLAAKYTSTLDSGRVSTRLALYQPGQAVCKLAL